MNRFKIRLILPLICLLMAFVESQAGFFPASDPRFRYTGRISFANESLPRFWQPGVYIDFGFRGDSCWVILNDQVLWGKSHNYIEIEVDGKATRLRLQNKTDTLLVQGDKSVGKHRVRIMKNTEANIGYMEFVGVEAEHLLERLPAAMHRIEFFGNSITCGAGSDESMVPCGTGDWQDQHNVYSGYAALTSKALGADFHLSSVSGIGLMHSCCNLGITMPQVVDKTDMRGDSVSWDFTRFRPDVVTVCLGQNDGIQSSAEFVNNYLGFLATLRLKYPDARFVCLGSPMADSKLTAFLEESLKKVVRESAKKGDNNVSMFMFSRQYSSGCDFHPSLSEHAMIARELSAYLRQLTGW